MLNDAVIVAVYSVLTVCLITTIAIALVQNVIRQLIRAYLSLSFCVLGWLLSAMVFFLITDPVLAAYVENVPFTFIALCPVMLFNFTLRFYNAEMHIPTRKILYLCIIPFLTCCIALLPPLHWMLRRDYRIVSLSPLHLRQFTWNFWFYIHLGYSYLLMMATAVLVIKSHFKKAIGNSLTSWLMVSGIVITILFNILTVTNPVTAWDFTLIGTGIATVIYYFAIVKNPSVEYLTLARNALFSHIDLPVLILDKNNRVLESNLAANSFLERIGCSFTEPFYYEDMIAAIEKLGGLIELGKDQNANTKIVLHQKSGSIVAYSLTQREVLNKKKQLLGHYIVVMDITQLSQMINELEHMVGVDPLTGIDNRRAFADQCEKMDCREALPLSIIIGDVNRLKYVNDTMGHHVGDKLLKLIASVLSDHCPADGVAARIGGDEFIMMVPGMRDEAARDMMRELEAGIMEKAKDFGGVSIALGVTTRTDMDQDIDELINMADREMYRKKRYDRRKQISSE